MGLTLTTKGMYYERQARNLGIKVRKREQEIRFLKSKIRTLETELEDTKEQLEKGDK